MVVNVKKRQLLLKRLTQLKKPQFQHQNQKSFVNIKLVTRLREVSSPEEALKVFNNFVLNTTYGKKNLAMELQHLAQKKIWMVNGVVVLKLVIITEKNLNLLINLLIRYIKNYIPHSFNGFGGYLFI